MKRNGEIDFFRFVFSVVIVFFHYNCSFHLGIFEFGAIGVEFFYIVTGYLMAKHVEIRIEQNSEKGVSIPDRTWRFMSRKISSFYQYYLSAFILQMLIRYIIIRRDKAPFLLFHLLKSIPTLTLTFMGLNRGNMSYYVPNTWYLSTMLIAVFILYPMLVKNYDFSVKLLFPMIAMLTIGYIYVNYQTLNIWEVWEGAIYIGVIRAIGEIALGCCICPVSSWLCRRFQSALSANTLRKTIPLTLVKYFCYAVVLVFAFGRFPGVEFKKDFELHALLFCFLGVLLSFSNVGYCIPDCELTRTLGKLSLPIFIFHGVIRWTIWDYGFREVSLQMFCAMAIFTIAACIIMMYVTDFIAGRLKRAFR